LQYFELVFLQLQLNKKEYLINCHILLQYFELVFLQLQLVQILCKLIII